MPTNMPWSMATCTNGQKCSICYREGKIFSFGEAVVRETGLHQYDKGFWKEIRKRIVEHFESEHPEYKITRLNEGTK